MKKLKMALLIIISTIVIYSCNGNHQTAKGYTKYYKTGRFLVKDSYDNVGRIIAKQYFDNDTIPDGAEIDYYPNGNIKKWRWFNLTSKYSYCIVYYHDNGAFDTIIGRPFISLAHNHKNNLLVELINPPNANIVIGYADFYNNELIKKIAYTPIPTDTTAWVILDKHKQQKDHRYMLYYYFVDAKNRVLGESPIELYNTANGEYKEPANSNKDSFVVVNRE